jgi:hypothetical protein
MVGLDFARCGRTGIVLVKKKPRPRIRRGVQQWQSYSARRDAAPRHLALRGSKHTNNRGQKRVHGWFRSMVAEQGSR